MNNLKSIIELGEGQFVEFKQSLDKSFSKEIVALANASGGIVYLGISDEGEIKGVTVSNEIISKIQDVARNCDPSIIVNIEKIESILAIEIKEGNNKPYSCSSGFYMRMGANSQKMKRDEILALAIMSGKVRYDEQICSIFDWKDFDDEKFEYYLKLAKISSRISREDILHNLRVLNDDGITNAGVLFFAKKPYLYLISYKVRLMHF
jgi:ATP-dependent DNA helicase RecG